MSQDSSKRTSQTACSIARLVLPVTVLIEHALNPVNRNKSGRTQTYEGVYGAGTQTPAVHILHGNECSSH